VNIKTKILYLEYAAGDTMMVENILDKGGIACTILTVNDKQSFLAALDNCIPDIILSDDGLRRLNSVDVLTILKQKQLSIPLIAVAFHRASENILTIVELMKQGAYDYILKENMDTLPNAIVSTIKKHKVNEQLLLSEVHEHALKMSEANLSAIIENTTDLVYSLDTELRFITFNQVFKTTIKAVYGFDIEQGVAIVDTLFGYDAALAEKWVDIYARALKGEAQQFVNEYKFGDGKVYLSYSINPIRETNNVIGLSCFSRDITSQRLLEIEREKITDDLLQRNKVLEQFTYIISHNLRAPVANIIGLSALSSAMEIENNHAGEIINNIGRSADKLDEVISDLNQVLQVKNQTVIENSGPVLLPKLIDDIKFSIKNVIEQEQVSISCDFGEHAEITSLKSFMYSIFHNLIQNSIKYRRQAVNPVINIKAKADDDKLTVIYTDNGRGIDTAKYANEIFGLYKRFDTSVEGKGMGLFMVKMQMESLGGNISIESKLDYGTQFTLEFPLQHLQKTNA
jgi:signal transduction histidine kinase